MIFLVFTRRGFDELSAAFGRVPSSLWVGGGVLSEMEIAELRSVGVSITDFSAPLDGGNPEIVRAALTAIAGHHPAETVWVESPAGAHAL